LLLDEGLRFCGRQRRKHKRLITAFLMVVSFVGGTLSPEISKDFYSYLKSRFAWFSPKPVLAYSSPEAVPEDPSANASGAASRSVSNASISPQFFPRVVLTNDDYREGKDVEIIVEAPETCTLNNPTIETSPSDIAPFMKLARSKVPDAPTDTDLWHIGLIGKGQKLILHYAVRCSINVHAVKLHVNVSDANCSPREIAKFQPSLEQPSRHSNNTPEYETVVSVFPSLHVLEGPEATLSAVTRGLPAAAVVHLAGHSITTVSDTELMLEGGDARTGAPLPDANVQITNNIELPRPIRTRVLITSPLETLSVGNTIVMSRGMIDVLPDEDSLAAVLSHEMAHIVLGHNFGSRCAFNNRMLFSDEGTYQNLGFEFRNPTWRNMQSVVLAACGTGSEQEWSRRFDGDTRSEEPYQELASRLDVSPHTFFVYEDADSGYNHGLPTGVFGNRSNLRTIHFETECVDYPVAANARSADCAARNRLRGTVVRIIFDPQSLDEFTGVNIEEPENWGTIQNCTSYLPQPISSNRNITARAMPISQAPEFTTGSQTFGVVAFTATPLPPDEVLRKHSEQPFKQEQVGEIRLAGFTTSSLSVYSLGLQDVLNDGIDAGDAFPIPALVDAFQECHDMDYFNNILAMRLVPTTRLTPIGTLTDNNFDSFTTLSRASQIDLQPAQSQEAGCKLQTQSCLECGSVTAKLLSNGGAHLTLAALPEADVSQVVVTGDCGSILGSKKLRVELVKNGGARLKVTTTEDKSATTRTKSLIWRLAKGKLSER